MRSARVRSKILKKFPSTFGGNRTQKGRRYRHNRDLVPRRGAYRPEEQDHASVGSARHPSACAPRSAHRFHLYLRRGLSEARKGRSPHLARLQYRGHEFAPHRDRQDRRAWYSCGASGRSSRLALINASPRAIQYHHHRHAAEIAGAQPSRKHLAAHARQLAFKPHLQVLRKSRRSLLLRLEQARQSTLADHVHRIARLGTWVLINETWY